MRGAGRRRQKAGRRGRQLELDKSQLQLPKLKEQKQKFCLSEVELAVRIPHFPLTGTETTVTLFAIHFIYLELDRDAEIQRERGGEGIRTLAMHSTPTGIEFESFVQRARTHMLMHTLLQSTHCPHRVQLESSLLPGRTVACAADQKPLIVIEWLRLQKKLLSVCPKVCAAFACSSPSSSLSLRVFVHLLRYT